ncbi:MAG: tetratricopeptide repeat protein [Armatimonadota bacterium]
MQHGLRLWALLTLCVVLLLPALVFAQTEGLDRFIRDGTDAFQKQRYVVAERHFKNALTEIEKLGIIDQRKAAVYNGLGLINIVRGKYDDGRQYLQQALVITQKSLGPAHPDVAQCLINLGDLQYTVGDFEGALKYYGQTMEVLEVLLVRRVVPDTALIIPLSNIAGVYVDRERFDDAIPPLQRAIGIIEQYGDGGSEADLVWCLKTLGEIYFKQQKLDEADPLLTKALPLAKKVYGETSPELLPILSRLADIRAATGKSTEAETLYKQVLAGQLAALTPLEAQNPDDPAIALTEHNLGVILAARKNYTDAIQYLAKALAIREAALGAEAIDTAATLQVLGEIYNAQKEYAFAQNVLERTLRIREGKLGRTHRDTGATLAALAEAEFNQRDVDSAEKHAKRALEIQEKSLGKDNPELITTLLILGTAYQAQDRFTDAETQYRRALAIREKAVGKASAELLPILKSLADTLFKQDRPLDAVDIIQRMRTIEEQNGLIS